MSSILKQLTAVGLLSERVYGSPDEAEDHVSAADAKVDPNEKQNLKSDPSASVEKKIEDEDEENPDKKDDDKEKEPSEKDEAEDTGDDTIKIDGSRALTSLHALLHSAQILADLVFQAKDELIGKLGDEAGPALHEVLFKVRTAHETLESILDKVADDPENDATDQEIKKDPDDGADKEQDKPLETPHPDAHPPLPKTPEVASQS